MSDSDTHIQSQTINKTVTDSSPLLEYDPGQPTQDPTFADGEPGIAVMENSDAEMLRQVDQFR